MWRCCPTRAMASSFTRFLDHTQRLTTFGRTPLDEWSAPRRDLYLTTHNTHKRQTSMLPAGFEPTISAGERPQTYALDRAARFNVGCHFTSLEPFSETFRVLLPILIITHFLSTLFFGSRRHAVCTYMSVLEFSPGTCNVSLFGAVWVHSMYLLPPDRPIWTTLCPYLTWSSARSVLLVHCSCTTYFIAHFVSSYIQDVTVMSFCNMGLNRNKSSSCGSLHNSVWAGSCVFFPTAWQKYLIYECVL